MHKNIPIDKRRVFARTIFFVILIFLFSGCGYLGALGAKSCEQAATDLGYPIGDGLPCAKQEWANNYTCDMGDWWCVCKFDQATQSQRWACTSVNKAYSCGQTSSGGTGPLRPARCISLKENKAPDSK